MRQRLVEGGERGVCIARAGESLEQGGGQLRQHFAGARAPDRGAPSEMPAANRFRGGRRIVEPEALKGRQRRRIVGDASEDEIAGRSAQCRRILEEPGIVAFDPRQVAGQVLREGFEPPIAAEFGEARERRALEGQALRLLVGDHLQPVLDAAQKEVGLAQVLLRPGADPVVGAELAQHVERARAAHLRTAAAEDQLLCLDEEFDLADAAAAELHVVAGHDDTVVAADRMNLALHCVYVGDGGVVEVLSPDERREVGKEALAERLDRPRRASP